MRPSSRRRRSRWPTDRRRATPRHDHFQSTQKCSSLTGAGADACRCRQSMMPTVRSKRSFAPWADPTERPLLRIEDVSKRFGGNAAVDKLSLDIYQGEFFALLGPSGCGKTTLLRLIAGFEQPDSGR